MFTGGYANIMQIWKILCLWEKGSICLPLMASKLNNHYSWRRLAWFCYTSTKKNRYLSSAMMYNSRAQEAIIFSWVRHPPPPLMRLRSASTSSAPSIAISIWKTHTHTHTHLWNSQCWKCDEVRKFSNALINVHMNHTKSNRMRTHWINTVFSSTHPVQHHVTLKVGHGHKLSMILNRPMEICGCKISLYVSEIWTTTKSCFIIFPKMARHPFMDTVSVLSSVN